MTDTTTEFRFIDKAEIGTLASLSHLFRDQCAYHDQFWAEGARRECSIEECAQYIMANIEKPGVRVVAMERNGQLVGFAMIAIAVSGIPCYPQYGSKAAEVMELFVAAEARSTGAGSQCIKFLEDFARGEDCTTIDLTCQAGNEPALRFYGRNGFQRVATRALMRKEL